jgi:hypothetical protein
MFASGDSSLSPFSPIVSVPGRSLRLETSPQGRFSHSIAASPQVIYMPPLSLLPSKHPDSIVLATDSIPNSQNASTLNGAHYFTSSNGIYCNTSNAPTTVESSPLSMELKRADVLAVSLPLAFAAASGCENPARHSCAHLPSVCPSSNESPLQLPSNIRWTPCPVDSSVALPCPMLNKCGSILSCQVWIEALTEAGATLSDSTETSNHRVYRQSCDFVVSTFDATVAAHCRGNITLCFSPRYSGPQSAILHVIASSANAVFNHKITLFAEGDWPRLSVSPAAGLHFGPVPFDSPVLRLPVKLDNTHASLPMFLHASIIPAPSGHTSIGIESAAIQQRSPAISFEFYVSSDCESAASAATGNPVMLTLLPQSSMTLWVTVSCTSLGPSDLTNVTDGIFHFRASLRICLCRRLRQTFAANLSFLSPPAPLLAKYCVPCVDDTLAILPTTSFSGPDANLVDASARCLLEMPLSAEFGHVKLQARGCGRPMLLKLCMALNLLGTPFDFRAAPMTLHSEVAPLPLSLNSDSASSSTEDTACIVEYSVHQHDSHVTGSTAVCLRNIGTIGTVVAVSISRHDAHYSFLAFSVYRFPIILSSTHL